MVVQWFPGHMAKTRRVIKECLSQVDIVLELLDARIPYSSKNPEISSLCAIRPVLTLFNKSTLADPNVTKKWIKEELKKQNIQKVKAKTFAK